MNKNIQFNRGFGLVQIIAIIAILLIGGIYISQKGSKSTDVAAPTSDVKITLLSPNGGEIISIGQPVTVSFKIERSHQPAKAEIRDVYKVVIWLDEGAAPLATIDATTTTYTFTVPESVLIGGDAVAPLEPGSYKIRVALYDGVPCTGHCLPSDVKELASDSSDGEITIKKVFTQPFVTSTTSKNIVIVSPTKSGVYAGTGNEIKWSHYSGTEELTIALVSTSNGVSSSTIIAKVPATTVTYRWIVTNAPKPNTTYRIEVYPAGGRELVGRSEVFSINPPIAVTGNQHHITVLSPNGGETYKIGSNMNIRWDVSNLGNDIPANSHLYISLIDGPTPGRIVSIVDIEDGIRKGMFTFPIQEYILQGDAFTPLKTGAYRLKLVITDKEVCDIMVPGVDCTAKVIASDESDNYFTITAPVSSSQPSITVLSPNGGEVLKMGTDYTIKLSNPSNEPVVIYLQPEFNGCSSTPCTIPFPYILAQGVTNVFQWKVGTVIGDTDRLICRSNNGTVINDVCIYTNPRTITGTYTLKVCAKDPFCTNETKKFTITN